MPHEGLIRKLGASLGFRILGFEGFGLERLPVDLFIAGPYCKWLPRGL